MPQLVIDKRSSYKTLDTEEIILLLVERDIPELKRAIANLEDSLNTDLSESTERISHLEEQVKEVKFDIKETKTSMQTHAENSRERNDTLMKEISSFKNDTKESFNKIDTKSDVVWYKDFRNILIIILVIGVMSLAGVKGADALFQKIGNQVINPSTTTATSVEEQPTTPGE